MVFRDKVLRFIAGVPRGKVVSYGQTAAACGYPRASRAVGGILKSLPEDSGVPWWRVVNAKGEITIKGNWTATKRLQKDMLENDGVLVDEGFKVNMRLYRHTLQAK